MPTEPQTITLTVNLGEETTPAEVNRATTQLYQDLLKSDADRVEKPRSDTLQKGAKGDPITVGLIALTLGVPAVAGVFTVLDSWISRRLLDSGSVTLKLPNGAEVTVPASASMPEDERNALLDSLAAQLKKHSQD